MTFHLKGACSLLQRCSGVTGFQVRARSRSFLTELPWTGLVLVSRSTDVFHNLALEDWIEANVDLERRSILLLWRNKPCVVIGRHQNPWAECHLSTLRESDIPLARRRSGGGTVFHDLGNLNMTFFASKSSYNRQRNLKVVTDALKRLRPQLLVSATDRFDIIMDGKYKISGSASRLSRKSSYHHCTLLHSADRSTLKAALRPSCAGILSNATPSVPSPVANLVDIDPSLGLEELLDAVAQQYKTEFGFSSTPIQVDPKDVTSFPGISDMESVLHQWEWTFGRTPKFSVHTFLPLPLASLPAELHLDVKNGVMVHCRLDVPPDWLAPQLVDGLVNVLEGQRFCPYSSAASVAAFLRSENCEGKSRLKQLSDSVLAIM
ncbi:lipoyltransferase 1, mitochondrial [Synchiropus splendidus]|uniref:lipoyltransferase 1, mitochondrial n=1 Tax=Synchiropus splendidus TaxID=270530 RepID=UPI00237D56EE|nr:lipoyltransferase 1, mitochondrial [Synchiropus splendidus]